MSPIRSMTLLCPIPYTVHARASNVGYAKVREYFTITEKAPTRAFSWLKVVGGFYVLVKSSRTFG